MNTISHYISSNSNIFDLIIIQGEKFQEREGKEKRFPRGKNAERKENKRLGKVTLRSY